MIRIKQVTSVEWPGDDGTFVYTVGSNRVAAIVMRPRSVDTDPGWVEVHREAAPRSNAHIWRLLNLAFISDVEYFPPEEPE